MIPICMLLLTLAATSFPTAPSGACVRANKRSTCDFSEKKTIDPDVTEPRSPGARNNVHTAPFLPRTLLHTPDQDEHHNSRAKHKMGNTLMNPPTLNKPRHRSCSLSTSSRPVCPTDEEHIHAAQNHAWVGKMMWSRVGATSGGQTVYVRW